MPIEQIMALALVQGITEFLPISSSGHLNLVHLLTEWRDQGPLADVAVHVGTLFAVLVYMWRDFLRLLAGAGHLLFARPTEEAKLLLLLILASLPVFAIGYIAFETGLIDSLRTIEVIAWSNLIFAVILWIADSRGLTIRLMKHTGPNDALLIGLSQVIALIPGASRTGVTMTAARFLGYERVEAARFSLLLSIPTISGLGAAAVFKLAASGDLELQADLGLAVIIAFIAAILSIWLMMAILRHTTMLVFVVYRIVLSLALLAIFYGLITIPDM
jgi:undecaprenyl-diphosphatase